MFVCLLVVLVIDVLPVIVHCSCSLLVFLFFVTGLIIGIVIVIGHVRRYVVFVRVPVLV